MSWIEHEMGDGDGVFVLKILPLAALVQCVTCCTVIPICLAVSSTQNTYLYWQSCLFLDSIICTQNTGTGKISLYVESQPLKEPQVHFNCHGSLGRQINCKHGVLGGHECLPSHKANSEL